MSESMLDRSIRLLGPKKVKRLLEETRLSEYVESLPRKFEEATALELADFIWEELNARPEQRLPQGDWDTWFIRAGRGWGKTRCGAQNTQMVAEEAAGLVRAGKLAKEEAMIYVVGATAADVRDVMVTGPAGLLRCSPPWFPARYEPSHRRITWPNGVHAMLFSAEEPDRLRGPQGIFGWLDELPAWKYAEDAWDNLQFGLRLGPNPRAMITATPRPTQIVKDILAAPGTITTKGHTSDNAKNLSSKALSKLYARYGGTRLGRQELGGEVLDDNPNALWKMSELDRLRLRPKPGQILPPDPGWSEAELPDFRRLMAAIPGRMMKTKAILLANGIDLTRIMIGVDPAVSNNEKSDETGIVVFGVGSCTCRGLPQTHGFLLEDLSGVYAPSEWGSILVRLFHEWRANKIIAEINNGGALVESNLRATDGGASLPYVGVHAKGGKLIRAEPIAGLYEQSKCHHVGTFAKLEDELTSWDPLDSTAASPNRLDGLVYAASELMLEPARVSYSKPKIPVPPRRI
jgi:phage terminase large subunit-like protein